MADRLGQVGHSGTSIAAVKHCSVWLGSVLRASIVCAMLLLSLDAIAWNSAPNDPSPPFWQLDVPMLVIEPESGAIEDANAAAAAFYGYPREALLRLAIQDINTHTEAQVAAERALAAREQRNYFLFRHRLADGGIQSVHVYSVPFTRDGRRLLLSLIQPRTDHAEDVDASAAYQQRLEDQVDLQTRQIQAAKQRQALLLVAGLVLQSGLIAYLLHDRRRRRVLQQQLTDALTQVRIIMDAAPDVAIMATDADGRIHTSNRLARDLFHLSSSSGPHPRLSEVLATQCRSHRDDAEPDRATKVQSAVHALLSGERQSIELHCPASDGSQWSTLKLRINPLHQEATEAQGVLCIARDLSRQSQSERMLQIERELFSTGPVFIVLWEMSAGWPVRFVSRNVLDALGYHAEELTASDFRFGNLLHPDDGNRVAEEVATHLSQQTASFEQTYRLRHRNGAYRWFFDLSKPQYDAHGLARTVQGYLFDQTPLIQVREALEAERHRLAGIIEGTHVGTWEWNVQTGATVFNERWAEIIGYSLGELTPTTIETWTKNVHPDDIVRSQQALQRLFSGQGKRYECEVRIRHKSGRWVWVLDRGKITERDAQGQPLWMMGTHQDITQRKEDEARLQLSASVFTHAREGILITDADARILEINTAFSTITGYTRAEAIGQTPRLLRSGHHDTDFYRDLWTDLLRLGHWQGELWNRRANGELFAEMLTISAIRDAQGAVVNYVGLFNDITPLKLQQQQLEQIAHYDALTGLPNRVLLSERLRHAMQTARNDGEALAIVFIDLDGFKSVNDRHGHDVGDELLVALTLRLRATLRDGDTLARIGGDEFVVILNHLSGRESSEAALSRLLIAASSPIVLRNESIQISASLGATCFPADSADAEQLIRHADQAMYIAKQSGKNRFQWFDVERDAAAKSHSAQLQRLLDALRDDEFVLHMQPIVNLRTGALHAVEALIRWPDQDGQLRLPGQFLPTLEGSPVAAHLDLWVIERALRQVCEWHQLGVDIAICVNVSAASLQSDDLVARLRELLSRYPNVPSHLLKLEVLETSALEDMPRTTAIMRACRELGLRFSLDDFGTGYSSLTYLRRLPADQLKIDQGFVRNMLDSPEDLTIVEGVLGLATAFGRGVIAEGVESIAHGELLLALGCELAQGFGIAPPMAADQVIRWQETWQPPLRWQEWQGFTPSRRNLPALMAQTEHRAWLRDIQLFVRQPETHPLPTLDAERCGFHRSFLQRELQSGQSGAIADGLESLHNEIHEIAMSLVAASQHPDANGMAAAWSQLQERSDALIHQMYRLIRTRAAN